MPVLVMKQIGSLFAFTTADVVGGTHQEVVGMTGNVKSVLEIGSEVEASHPALRGRKCRLSTTYNPSPKGTAMGRRTRRRGGQRHDRTHGD